MGFEVAFDDRVSFPLSGTVVGHEVEVLSVSIPNGRRELVARCRHGGRRYDLVLLDVDCSGDLEFDRIRAAYANGWAHDGPPAKHLEGAH